MEVEPEKSVKNTGLSDIFYSRARNILKNEKISNQTVSMQYCFNSKGRKTWKNQEKHTFFRHPADCKPKTDVWKCLDQDKNAKITRKSREECQSSHFLPCNLTKVIFENFVKYWKNTGRGINTPDNIESPLRYSKDQEKNTKIKRKMPEFKFSPL